MARSVRFTKAERELLCRQFDDSDETTPRFLGKSAKLAASILAKVRESEEQPSGVDVGPIEDALVAAGRGKVLRLEGGFGRASAMASSLKVTPELAAMVGSYLARNTFFTGPFHLLDVLNKWHQWLPKARATQPPPSLAAGLGTDAADVRSSAPAGKAPAGGRSTPGFR